jgi:ribosome-associated protein
MIDPVVFENECIFRTSRSSGKGGQNVNKTETKVGLWFDVAASTLFDDDGKARICSKLASAITDEGYLQLNCDEQRSQLQNKQLVIERAIRILEKALIVAKPRKKVKPSKAMVEKRLEDKRRTSIKKSERSAAIQSKKQLDF